MSKTSLDFGLFCDVNQNLKARRFLADYLGNGILLHRVQNVMVCDLWSVDFDPFCVFSVFVRVSVFSRFCSQVFLPSYWKMTSLDSQGEIVQYRDSKYRRNTDMGGWKRTGTFPPTFNFSGLFVITAFIWQGLDAMVAVWLTSKKNPKSGNVFDYAGRVLSYPASRGPSIF